MDKPRIGMIGLGLMGLGIATNIVKKGYALTAMEHAGNQPLADLMAAGARTVTSARAVAQHSDTVILVVNGSAQIDAILAGDEGLLAGLREGMTVIDCSTSLPASTVQVASALAQP
jgi:3-hydroxyisobutyrate dehydrogenase-like beta-hydroxyacid dehydrogenase